MKKNQIPILKLPTTIMLVDDNQLFLDSMANKLRGKYLTQTFSNALLALDELPKHSFIETFFEDAFDQTSSKEIDIDIEHPIFNYKQLLEIIYSQNRFSEISVVVVDFCMPGQINGIEFCSKINSSLHRKIILTGHENTALAVNAFNNKVIDRYITKDLDDIVKDITEMIDHENTHFFKNLSMLVPGWGVNDNKRSVEFYSTFNAIIEKYSICEYYQVGKNEYLMLDKGANITWFILQSEDESKYFRQVAEDNDAPKDLINKLKDRSHIIYLYSEYENKLPVDCWSNYLFPVHGVLDGCYYTIIENKSFSLERKKIKSYSEYMASLSK